MGHLVARYICSLAPLTPLTRSALLRLATLTSLACFFHGLPHSLRSLPRGTVEILEYVFTLLSRFREQTRFWRSPETRPSSFSTGFQLWTPSSIKPFPQLANCIHNLTISTTFIETKAATKSKSRTAASSITMVKSAKPRMESRARNGRTYRPLI